MSTMVYPFEEKLERFSQEEIISSTKLVIQVLEAVKMEHNSVHQRIKTKSSLVERIELGLGEAQMMLGLQNHLNMMELEKLKLRSQVRKLDEENRWLWEELTFTCQKLQKSEQRVAQLEEENRHLEFMNQLKKADEAEWGQFSEETEGERLKDFLDDIFPKEEEEQLTAMPQHQETLFLTFKRSARGHFFCFRAVSVYFSSSNAEQKKGSDYKILRKLAKQYADQGLYEAAIIFLKSALENLEKAFGHDNEEVDDVLSNLASIYRHQKKFDEVTYLLDDILAIREKTLGKDHKKVAEALNNLVVMHGKRGNYKEAESLCKRALEIREKALGRDHPDMAKQLNNMALLSQKQGKYEEVEYYYCRALEIFERQLGPDDHVVAKVKTNLAACYLNQGKLKEAEITYKEILTHAHELEFGLVDTENKTIWMFAEEREDMSKGRTGEVTYSVHSGEFREWYKACKVNSPVVCKALQSLLELYQRQGKMEAARTLEECALGYHKEPLKDGESGGKRRSNSLHSLTSIKYESRDEGSVEWNGDGTGTLMRSASLGKLKDVLRRSSEMLVKKIQSAMPPEHPNANVFWGMNRMLADSRERSSSAVELYSGKKSHGQHKTLKEMH
ncbi:kinesin light chain 1-like [Denticeps clupeoides]|uniref:kinesin light chain 1-like n=1 Tax=Denticeps clupeoides TaxID=299321 RepID=UPI0010A40E1D|nr:kinesin light chain 1-like [Denticeps clupeoides]